MILASAVVIGLVAGLARAGVRRLPYQTPELRYVWLVFLALFAQWLVLNFSGSWLYLTSTAAAMVLVGSQIMLFVFALANRAQPAFWLLGTGLVLNLAVMVANGGLMPIAPEMAARLAQAEPGLVWQIGERLGTGKDIVLNAAATRLWFLSDHFLLLPSNLGYQVVFSPGDVLVAAGAFWLLFSPLASGRRPKLQAGTPTA